MEQFHEFQAELKAVFASEGITDATVQQVGSATLGWKGNPKKPLGPWRPESDVDMAVFSPKALAQAKAVGVPVNEKVTMGGKYTVLKNEVPGGSGFYDTPLGKKLEALARRWNKIIYGNEKYEGFDFKLNLADKLFSGAVTIIEP